MPSSSKPAKQVKVIQRASHGSDTPGSAVMKQHKDSPGTSRRPPPQTRPSSPAPNIAQHTMIPAQTASTGYTDPASQYPNTATDDDEDSVTTIDTSASIQRPDTPPASPVEPSKELVAAVVRRIASAVSLTPVPSDTDLVMRSSRASRPQDLPVVPQVQQNATVDLLQQLVDLWKKAFEIISPLNASEKALATSVDSIDTNGAVQEFMRLAAIQPDVLSAESLSTTTAPAASTATESSAPPKERASKLTYASVREVWDKILFEYKIVTAPIVKETIENEYNEHLFVVRNRTERSSEKAIKYIDINSTAIRDVLCEILKGVHGVSLRAERPSIEQNLLFHFLDKITERYETIQKTETSDSVTLTHLGVLLQYLGAEYRTVQDRSKVLLDVKEIEFDLLWTLFSPNIDVVTLCPNTDAPRCVRCNFAEERKRSNGTTYFHIEGRYLDFDGKTFGSTSLVLSIEKFRGAKAINLLSAYPLCYHNHPAQLTDQLVNCGRKFVSLLGMHHQTYEGKAFYVDSEERRITISITKSRIIVDAAYFRERNPNYPVAKVESTGDTSGIALLWIDDVRSAPAQEAPLQAIEQDPKTLPEEELLICSSTVPGYSLKYKMWLEFAVMHIGNISWDTESFDRLNIPKPTKQAVLAVSAAHSGWNADAHFEDFVAGKGQGRVVLLHGPPGVGKTLTAETVSEHMQRPFYMISAGELGTTPGELETKLSNILEIASHWKVTLLLDEADIFVEQRSTHDVNRNALVCIFLRKLEYYPGIIFFTTNRVKIIDEAIASRIHLSLRYGDIDQPGRKKLWETQLAKAVTPYGPANCHSRDLDYLAQQQLNGREITNIISTAQAMAAFDKKAVSLDYLKIPIELNRHFQLDFRGAGHFDNQNSYF